LGYLHEASARGDFDGFDRVQRSGETESAIWRGMMPETTCLSEAKYLLERALRTRGFHPVINERRFSVTHANGAFSLTFMAGNRRVLISHDVRINSASRGKGLGRKMLQMRQEIAREAGVNLILATVKNENSIENHLLESDGWKKFLDRKETGVSLWGKEL
jgi:hypothetical protein